MNASKYRIVCTAYSEKRVGDASMFDGTNKTSHTPLVIPLEACVSCSKFESVNRTARTVEEMRYGAMPLTSAKVLKMPTERASSNRGKKTLRNAQQDCANGDLCIAFFFLVFPCLLILFFFVSVRNLLFLRSLGKKGGGASR